MVNSQNGNECKRDDGQQTMDGDQSSIVYGHFRRQKWQNQKIVPNAKTLQANTCIFFAPDNESGPDLSKMFSGKPLSKGRKALVAYACNKCGFTRNSMHNLLTER